MYRFRDSKRTLNSAPARLSESKVRGIEHFRNLGYEIVTMVDDELPRNRAHPHVYLAPLDV